MATHTKATRDNALARLRNGDTLADVHHDTSVPKQTLSRWAKDAEIDLGRTGQKMLAVAEHRWAERRAVIADEAGQMVAESLTEIRRLVAAGDYLNAQRLVTVFGVGVDKAQLLTGDATQRHEHVSPERGPDQEQEMAEVLTLVKSAA